MKYIRLYSGDDGEAHFEDLEMPLQDRGRSTRTSAMEKAVGISFRETGGDFVADWHNAPRKQYIFILEGEVEVEVRGGTKRRFGPGDIQLIEDTTGRGHITRSVNNQPWKAVFIPLE